VREADVAVRAETTAATRRAIVGAARELLAAGDWARFTLEAVAGAAGVTRVTVYNQVGSKHGLLDAVLTDLVGRARMDRLVTDSQSLAPAAARTFVVRRTCRFWHAERAVLRPLFGLAAVDRGIADNLERRERWRGEQFGALLDRLAPGGDLPLPRDSVLAGMVAVTSFPAYDRLGALADHPVRAAALVDHLVAGLTG
jgi:AcrR family transcriptional regulator